MVSLSLFFFFFLLASCRPLERSWHCVLYVPMLGKFRPCFSYTIFANSPTKKFFSAASWSFYLTLDCNLQKSLFSFPYVTEVLQLPSFDHTHEVKISIYPSEKFFAGHMISLRSSAFIYKSPLHMPQLFSPSPSPKQIVRHVVFVFSSPRTDLYSKAATSWK